MADLLAGLASPDAETRCSAANGLRDLGPAASAAVPSLARALRDGASARVSGSDYVTVAECAADALEAIGGPAVPALLEALEEEATFGVPVMCFDQGAYIGDYASRDVSVSDLAGKALRRLIARDGRYVDLIAELGKRASDEEIRRWISALRAG